MTLELNRERNRHASKRCGLVRSYFNRFLSRIMTLAVQAACGGDDDNVCGGGEWADTQGKRF